MCGGRLYAEAERNAGISPEIVQKCDVLISPGAHQRGHGLPLVISNFKGQQSAGAERGIRQNTPVKAQSICAAVQRGEGLVFPHLTLEAGNVPAWDIGRVGDNDIRRGKLRHAGQDIMLLETDPVLQMIAPCRLRGCPECRRGNVQLCHLQGWMLMGKADSDTAASAANVPQGDWGGKGTQPCGNSLYQELCVLAGVAGLTVKIRSIKGQVPVIY